MRHHKSQSLGAEAAGLLPGGVSSPVRAFKAVGGEPIFVQKGQGSFIFDVDGNSYIDYVMGYGPMILGHAHPVVVGAVTEAVKDGFTFGATHEGELELASLIQRAFPVAQRVRFVNSGTEAAMSAIRLARGYTNRNLILKFRGHYHGHSDGLLVEAGSGALTLGQPSSAGVPAEIAGLTILTEFNDGAALREAFARYGSNLAAVIFEPVMANAGVISPEPGFLRLLAELAQQNGTLVIADEVITGFRLAFGGASELYDLKPDLVLLGKIVGGGLPLAAFAGQAEIMEQLAPLGPVYQAGTLAGNPVAVAAGLATLRVLYDNLGIYPRLERATRSLSEEIRRSSRELGVELTVNQIGSLWSIFFNPGPVANYQEAKNSDSERFAEFFHNLLEHGIYLAPSPFEAAFVSAAHSQDDLEQTLNAIKSALAELS